MTPPARVARLLAAVAGLGLILVVLSRGSAPGGPPHLPLPRLPPSTSPPAETMEADRVAIRNVFRYAEPLAEPRRSRAATPAPEPAPTAPPLSLKLVGIVNKGGTRRAVLALSGEVTLAGVGESLGGYTVLAIDEESGVRLRDPDGGERTLPLPP